MRPVVRLKGGTICRCADALLAGAAFVAWCRHRDRLFGRDKSDTLRSHTISRAEWISIVRGMHRGSVMQSLTHSGPNGPIAEAPKAHPALTCAALLFGTDPADLRRPTPETPSILEAVISSRRRRYWYCFGRAAAGRKGAEGRSAQAKPEGDVGARQKSRRAQARPPLELLKKVGLSEIAFFPCEPSSP